MCDQTRGDRNPFSSFALPEHSGFSLCQKAFCCGLRCEKKQLYPSKAFLSPGDTYIEGESQADLCSQTTSWSDMGKTHLTCDKSASVFIIALNVPAKSTLF